MLSYKQRTQMEAEILPFKRELSIQTNNNYAKFIPEFRSYVHRFFRSYSHNFSNTELDFWQNLNWKIRGLKSNFRTDYCLDFNSFIPLLIETIAFDYSARIVREFKSGRRDSALIWDAEYYFLLQKLLLASSRSSEIIAMPKRKRDRLHDVLGSLFYLILEEVSDLFLLYFHKKYFKTSYLIKINTTLVF